MKIILIISLALILLLLILSNFNQPFIIGKVTSMKISNTLTVIIINHTEILVFDTLPNLENKTIKIYGKEKEKIADKIVCLNC